VAQQVKRPPSGAAETRHRVAVPASAVSRTPAVTPAVAVAPATRVAATVVALAGPVAAVVATPAAAVVEYRRVVPAAHPAVAGVHRAAAVAADITKPSKNGRRLRVEGSRRRKSASLMPGPGLFDHQPSTLRLLLTRSRYLHSPRRAGGSRPRRPTSHTSPARRGWPPTPWRRSEEQ